MTESEVLIVGAGPTGLTLAIDLGKRGVRATLIEQKEKPAFLPKMERINARSMEIYRRLGLSQKIRAAGLRPDCPMDVYVMLALNEPPLLHLTYPSVEEAQKTVRATNDGTMPLEPYQLISQYTLEPLLKSIAETIPAIDVRFGCEFVSLKQDGDGVTAQVKTTNGRTEEIRAKYLVGCDGGASAVRKELGIELSGEGNLLGLRQALFKCDELFDRLPLSNGAGKGQVPRQRPPLSCRRRQGDVPDHAGFDQALDAAFGGRHRRRDEGAVRAHHRRSGQIRDAVMRAVAAESPARGPLRRGPRLHRRRCGASGHSDRRARHEFRRRRRDRSRLEARGDAQGLGRAGAARILRGRAPPDRRPQCRRLALCHHRPAQMARHVAGKYPRQFAGRRARRERSLPPSPMSSSARATR